MIERHYFKDKLIRSYDFAFGFCIPGSTNSWEAIYPMPELTEDERKYTLDGGGDGGALTALPMCRAALRRRACGCGCRCMCARMPNRSPLPPFLLHHNDDDNERR